MINYAMTQKNTVKLITGDYYKEKRIRTNKRVIVFDLDETIGHFHHLNIIYKCLVEVLHRELTQTEFNQLLDLFPEFFRPGILTIFDFLFSKKRDHSFFKLYIYTNNQCSENWAKMIAEYIQSKVSPSDVSLFDKIIGAFKIKNKVVELKRTSNTKSYSDFIQCAMLPESTVETCFIDNTYYEKMCESKVYYILPKAYFHSLKKSTMIQRIASSLFSKVEELLIKQLPENNRSTTGNEVAITKKIMYLVREFLYYPKFPRTNKTVRRCPPLNKKSRKRYGNK
jgi:hypothetical protein